MLKTHRLRSSAEFRQVIGSRHSENGKYFQVYVKASLLAHARLGMIVAKRLVRKAVHRNLAKRLIREAFRHQQEALSGYDVVVRLRIPLPAHKPCAARQELVNLFEKLRLCRV